jgi:hypothetical protein
MFRLKTLAILDCSSLLSLSVNVLVIVFSPASTHRISVHCLTVLWNTRMDLEFTFYERKVCRERSGRFSQDPIEKNGECMGCLGFFVEHACLSHPSTWWIQERWWFRRLPDQCWRSSWRTVRGYLSLSIFLFLCAQETSGYDWIFHMEDYSIWKYINQ